MNQKKNQQKETAFYCSSVYHLVNLSRAAQSVYDVGMSLTKGEEDAEFFASAKQLADYIGYEVKQIKRARAELTELGFFELKRERDFDTNVYRVLTHKQWAERHPGQCAEKVVMPWEGEGDPLGQKLYAASAGEKSLRDYQTLLLRRTEISEDIIVDEFRMFLRRWKPNGPRDASCWFDRFFDTLKWRTALARDIDRLVFRIYEETGHVFPHFWQQFLSAMLNKDGLTVEQVVERYKAHVANRGLMKDFCTQADVTRARLAKHMAAKISPGAAIQ